MPMHAIYEWFRRHRFAVDFLGMLALWLLLGVTMLGSGVVHFIIATLLIVPLAWRRTQPVVAGAAVAAAALVQWAWGVPPIPADIAVIFVLYALAAYAPRWASRAGLGLALTGAILLVTRYYWPFTGTEFIAGLPYAAIMVLMTWLLTLFSWALGDLTRARLLREQALEDRARRLEIEQQQERALAASDERAHIAREMHDIVAHSLSVIIAQADGARYAAEHDPAVAQKALATISNTGRTSLREMRRLLGVLRSDHDESTASTRPLPGLSDTQDLLLGFRSVGLEIKFLEDGVPRRALPAGAELTVYRIAQEALTNVLKHGGPKARASLGFTWDQRGLHIDVTDNGRGAAADPPSPHGGNGLLGMAERVRLYDGTLESGPRVSGGFQVKAFIPYTEA